MENFVVSARKYRPVTFRDVVGQSHITTTLKNAIRNNHLAQAFLFCGPRGVGKTTCARILAKTINCENITSETEACNECSSCKSFMNNNSFNIHELDAASNNSVDDIRSLVDQVRYAPQAGKYKIYIIDEVHMLSNAAFNAFLKTLEEPPSYAIFILATTEKHKIIPTILSRCQIFDFNRIEVSDIIGHLQYIAQNENVTCEEEALHLIAQKADGALRDALSVFDLMVTFSGDNKVSYQATIANLHILDYEYYFKVTDYLLDENTSQVLLIFDDILRKGFDGHNFIVGLGAHFRNLMVCKDNEAIQLLQVSDSVKSKYTEQAKGASLSFLLTALNIINTCDLHYKSSKNQRLHVELALIKIAHIQAAVNISQAESVLNPLKKKVKPTIDKQAAGDALDNNDEKTTVDDHPKEDPVVVDNNKSDTIVQKSHNEKANTDHLAVATHVKEVETLPVAGMNILQTPRIDNLKERLEKKDQSQLTQRSEEKKNQPFDENTLKEYWNSYKEKVRKEEKEAEYTVLNSHFTLKKDYCVELELASPLQVDILERFKDDFLSFLRKSLENYQLDIQVSLLKENNKTKKLYTAKEKFNHLAAKQPLLKDLKERFGLDEDF